VSGGTYCGACDGGYSAGGYDETSVDRYVGAPCGCKKLLPLHILYKPLHNIIKKSTPKSIIVTKDKAYR